MLLSQTVQSQDKGAKNAAALDSSLVDKKTEPCSRKRQIHAELAKLNTQVRKTGIPQAEGNERPANMFRKKSKNRFKNDQYIIKQILSGRSSGSDASLDSASSTDKQVIRGRTESLKAKIHKAQPESQERLPEQITAKLHHAQAGDRHHMKREHKDLPKNIYLIDSSDSDIELPKKTAFKAQGVKDNLFLQQFRQHNEIHCLDRERAKNIVKNLKMPRKKGCESNSFLNKNRVKDDVFEVDMKLRELADLQ